MASTKEVDLFGKWQATIKRPSMETWMRWKLLIDPTFGKPAPYTNPYEPNPPAQAEPEVRIGPEAYGFLERTMLPECTLRIIDETGQEHRLIAPGQGEGLEPADLGSVRFSDLAGKILAWTEEADGAAFRLHQRDAGVDGAGGTEDRAGDGGAAGGGVAG